MAMSASCRLTTAGMAQEFFGIQDFGTRKLRNPPPSCASHWEVQHEIRISEREIALLAILLREVQAADRGKLSARSRDEPDLLRRQLLHGPLQKRSPDPVASCESIVKAFSREQDGIIDLVRRTIEQYGLRDKSTPPGERISL